MPELAHVVVPHGGLFVWAWLPDGVSAVQRLKLAREEGVEYAPVPRFFVQPAKGESYLRLNFATQTVEDMSEGVQRLVRAFQRLQAQR